AATFHERLGKFKALEIVALYFGTCILPAGPGGFMPSKNQQHLIAILLSTTSLTMIPAAFAQAPDNETLYKMVLELKANQEKLKQEAAKAKAEADQVRNELRLTQER